MCVHVFVCVCTYSLRGRLGAGGRTVCAKLWTEPAWRYPEPAGQQVTEARNAWLNKPRLSVTELCSQLSGFTLSHSGFLNQYFSLNVRGETGGVF